MLSGKQKRFLRALGHSLKPVILIGKKDIDDSVINETEIALEHHELIKVKLLESAAIDKHEASEMLAEACNADVAQILGRTFLLYRKSDKAVIELPSSK